MKKILSFFLALALVFSVIFNAFAVSTDKLFDEIRIGEYTIIVHCISPDNAASESATGGSAASPDATRTTIGLNKHEQNLNKCINAETTVKSKYNYKTNSTEITVKAKAKNGKTSLTVMLFDASTDTRVGATTLDLSTSVEKKITFTNLDSNTTYYFKYRNNSQYQETITGKATD